MHQIYALSIFSVWNSMEILYKTVENLSMQKWRGKKRSYFFEEQQKEREIRLRWTVNRVKCRKRCWRRAILEGLVKSTNVIGSIDRKKPELSSTHSISASWQIKTPLFLSFNPPVCPTLVNKNHCLMEEPVPFCRKLTEQKRVHNSSSICSCFFPKRTIKPPSKALVLKKF